MFIRTIFCSLLLALAFPHFADSQPPPPPPGNTPILSLSAGSFNLFESTAVTSLGSWGVKVGTGAVIFDDELTHVKPQLYARYGVHSNLSLGIRVGGMISTEQASTAPLGAVFEFKWGTLELPHVADLAAGGGLGFINDGQSLSFMGELSLYESNDIASFLTSYSATRVAWLLNGRSRVQLGAGLDIKFSQSTHLLMEAAFSIGAGAFHPAAGLAISANL